MAKPFAFIMSLHAYTKRPASTHGHTIHNEKKHTETCYATACRVNAVVVNFPCSLLHFRMFPGYSGFKLILNEVRRSKWCPIYSSHQACVFSRAVTFSIYHLDCNGKHKYQFPYDEYGLASTKLSKTYIDSDRSIERMTNYTYNIDLFTYRLLLRLINWQIAIYPVCHCLRDDLFDWKWKMIVFHLCLKRRHRSVLLVHTKWKYGVQREKCIKQSLDSESGTTWTKMIPRNLLLLLERYKHRFDASQKLFHVLATIQVCQPFCAQQAVIFCFWLFWQRMNYVDFWIMSTFS